MGVVINNMGDNDTEIGGTLPQPIRSCLAVMDDFLCNTSSAVLSSFVISEKRSASKDGGQKDIVAAVFNILGKQLYFSTANFLTNLWKTTIQSSVYCCPIRIKMLLQVVLTLSMR